MTWPTLRNPTTTIIKDLGDSALMGWEVQWGWYALLHQPDRLFDANAFFPEPLSFAYSDTLLGYVPLGVLGDGPRAGILIANLVYVLACALAAIGGYALARQLGANRLGSTVAGLAMAYAPWRLGQAGHFHVISTGGIMLSLAMLARGHGFSIRHGYQPERVRPGWIVAGWLTAAWQMTIGFGIGLPFAYVLLGMGVVAVLGWLLRGRPRVPRAAIFANLGGGAVFAVITLLMARPYLQVVELFPYARRSAVLLQAYSPPFRGLFTGPPESLWWRDDHLGLQASLPTPAEMAVLPGFALYLLAGIGLVISVWSKRWRAGLGIATAVSAALALGTRFPGNGHFTYLLLYDYLPGFDAIRTPGRLIVWTTLVLGLLAAGAVTAASDRVRWRLVAARGRSLTLGHGVGVLASALVLVEGLSALANPVVPPPPPALTAEYAEVVRPPLLVLPSDVDFDTLVMLWSTDGFPKIVNGLSGFTPASTEQLRTGTYNFPDPASVTLLRESGVRTVVVLPERIAGTPWAEVVNRPVDGLGITRQQIGDAVVFSLD
jgi:hypothetical protein